GISFREKAVPEVFINTIEDKYRKLRTNLATVSADVSLFKEWRLNLHQLATNIERGNMPVSPKINSNVCQFCEYSGFCRVKESQPENPAAGEGANGEGEQ
ncbi:MAG: PD-(D/E)XK nuclease family protein, partial [Kangiellaceae bacterium]|nr:PD-(D/E)XK nuclease family protein [Kangiellaceae bacterium]